MSYARPKDTNFDLWELDVLDRDCPFCGRRMHVCDHRYRHFHALTGPVELVCKLNHCPDPTCPGHATTKSPELEVTIALPKWAIGWDVFCWIGHRRWARHWSIPQIQTELRDSYAIPLSADAMFTLAHVQQAAGEPLRARATLQHAVRLQPSNPQTWVELGRFDLRRDPRAAVQELQLRRMRLEGEEAEGGGERGTPITHVC